MIRVEASGPSLRSRDEFIPTQACPASQPCSLVQEPPRKYFDTHELVCVCVCFTQSSVALNLYLRFLSAGVRQVKAVLTLMTSLGLSKNKRGKLEKGPRGGEVLGVSQNKREGRKASLATHSTVAVHGINEAGGQPEYPQHRLSGESCNGRPVRCLVLWDSKIFISVLSFGFKAGAFGLVSGGLPGKPAASLGCSVCLERPPHFLAACCSHLSSHGDLVLVHSFKGSETNASRALISCLTSGPLL